MRIWYQGMTTTDGVDGLRERMVELVSRVAHPDTTVDFFGLDGGPDGALKGIASNYMALHRLQIDQVIANARRAEAEGYDAFICGSIDDPGLREARTLVDIPVVGYGQTAMHVASMFGSKVAVLAISPDYFPLIEENIVLYGLDRRFVPVVHLDINYSDLAATLKDPSAFAAALDDATARARQLGADIAIPGQAPINEALFVSQITESNGLPILNTRALTIKFTEMVVNVRRTVGFEPARRGYFGKRPPDDLVKLSEEVYRLHGHPAHAAPLNDSR